MRRTLSLAVFCAALSASADNTAQATNPPLKPAPKSVAVFVLPKEANLAEPAGRLDAELSRALLAKNIELVDLAALFPPPEPESLEPAKKAYQAGREAYDNLDPDTAVAKFTEAIATYLKHPVEVQPAALAEAYVWLGASLQLKGDLPGAKEAFTNALLTDTNATADPQIFAKDLLTLFGEARADLARHPNGKLQIDSIPAGGRAFVRGEDVGVTPVDELDAPSGRVRVVITRPGYVPFGAFPEVPTGQPVQLKPQLEPTPGLARVQADVMKLTTPNAFKDPKLPPSAKAVGDKLSARFLVLSSVSSVNGKATAELQAWDLLTGNKLTGITVDASSGDA
ncbi:MAG: PEGA domain-containing protein, partial [Myxococcaceae bacterium]